MDSRFCFIWCLRIRFLGVDSHEWIHLSTNYVIRLIFQNQSAQHLVKLLRQLRSMSIKWLPSQERLWESGQYVATEKSFKGHQKMTEPRLIHLAQPARHHELTGESIGPWCRIYMQKNWINEETSGYFRWYQNDQFGRFIEMCNLARNQIGKKTALNGAKKKIYRQIFRHGKSIHTATSLFFRRFHGLNGNYHMVDKSPNAVLCTAYWKPPYKLSVLP